MNKMINHKNLPMKLHKYLILIMIFLLQSLIASDLENCRNAAIDKIKESTNTQCETIAKVIKKVPKYALSNPAFIAACQGVLTNELNEEQIEAIILTLSNNPTYILNNSWFIGACNLSIDLSMTGEQIAYIIQTLAKLPTHVLENPSFIPTCNSCFTGDQNVIQKVAIIHGMIQLNPNLYDYLAGFNMDNFNFFKYVPIYEFMNLITDNMTQQQLHDVLVNLHNEYFNQAPNETKKDLIF